MNVVAIIQARMGSTRLPGKVLLDIAGAPMLARVVERVRKASTIHRIVVATTTSRPDDAIVECGRDLGAIVYRGDEEDVLDRYYRAAAQNDADVIVRVTSDCPLIDPQVVDAVVAPLLDERAGVEFAANTLDRSFPRGLDVEVASSRALTRVWETARQPHHRAHVFPYVYEHRDAFRIVSVTDAVDRSHMRWTVDTADDLRFVREVHRALGGREFTWRDVLAVLEREPALSAINADVRQKAAIE